MSLRKAIDDKCRLCIFDDVAPGSWRVQVTLCAVTSCPLWPVRPKTGGMIAESTLRWYEVDSAEIQDDNATQCSNSCEPTLSRHDAKTRPFQDLEQGIEAEVEFNTTRDDREVVR